MDLTHATEIVTSVAATLISGGFLWLIRWLSALGKTVNGLRNSLEEHIRLETKNSDEMRRFRLYHDMTLDKLGFTREDVTRAEREAGLEPSV